MNKLKQYIYIILGMSLHVYAQLPQTFIVLDVDENMSKILETKDAYTKLLRIDSDLAATQKNEHFELKIEESKGIYVLKIGPLLHGDMTALTYVILRDNFPQAFLLDEPFVQTVIKNKVQYIEKEIIIEHEDQSLWIALFGLGIIGIFALFLSSDQLKNLRLKHKQIQKRQVEIEKTQSMLLEKMGEKIQTVALKTVNEENLFFQKSLANIDKEEIVTQIVNLKKNDEELLHATYEMIDFLKIKSGNIVIKEEPFQLSNMLHKLTNVVAPYIKDNEHTLQYKIDLNLTRYIIGDTTRIFQVLHNILIDVFEDEKARDVTLSIYLDAEDKIIYCIENKEQYLTMNEIEDLFVPISWEDVQKSNKEFSFFFINELVDNMEGKFIVESAHKQGTRYVLTLPYIKDGDNRSKKEALKNVLIGKKALLIDTKIEKIEALKNILESFGIEVTFKDSENLALYRPNMDGISFIIIKEDDISKKVFDYLKLISDEDTFKVVVIFDIFENVTRDDRAVHIADAELYSPLIVGDVEEVLKELCFQASKAKKLNIRQELQNFSITDKIKVSREDFRIFGKKKILLVEDNIVSQQVTKSILSAGDFNIHHVENGVEALIFLGNNTDVDIVLMDINMPVMDGYETTRKIRENELLKDIPVVAVTGLGFYNELEQMVFAGLDACVIKPYKIGQLYTVFKRFFDSDKELKLNVKQSVFKGQRGNDILDIDKGISYVRNEQFYKEIVSEVLLALHNSDILVEEMIYKGKLTELRAFCVDAIGLSGTIGALEFVKLLHGMLVEMKKDEYAFLVEYIMPYREAWKSLELEMENYLIS